MKGCTECGNRCQPNQGILGNQGNGLCLINIRGKSGSLANTRDDQGDVKKIFVFVFSNNWSANMLKKLSRKQSIAILILLVLIFHDSIGHTSPTEAKVCLSSLVL